VGVYPNVLASDPRFDALPVSLETLCHNLSKHKYVINPDSERRAMYRPSRATLNFCTHIRKLKADTISSADAKPLFT